MPEAAATRAPGVEGERVRRYELPTVAVLAAVAAGLGLVAAGHWRAGSYGVALALLLAGSLRLTLTERAAGLLAVRSRGLDGTVLLTLGFGLLLLANSLARP